MSEGDQEESETNLRGSENSVELVDGREPNPKISVLFLHIEGDDAVIAVVQTVSVVESILSLVKRAGDELKEEKGSGKRVSFDASSF